MQLSYKKGFSLLEVMISLFILTFGMLGIAGMITQSLKDTQGNNLSMRAEFVAYDVVDRLRANKAQATADAYDGEYEAENADDEDNADDGDNADDNAAVESDLTEIRSMLQSLPAGQVTIAVESNGSYDVSVQWNNSRTQGGSDEENIRLRGAL